MVLPFKFSFIETEFPKWDLIERSMDLVFLFEIIFTFFTPFYNNKNFLEVRHKQIALNYILSKWFWIDLISIIPFDLMFDFDNNYSVFLKIWKLPRFYKMLKIGRLFKNLAVKKKGNSWLVKVKNFFAKQKSIIQIIPVGMTVFIICHCAACMWHFFGWYDDSPYSWVSRNKYRDEDIADRYVVSMYFIVQTITTVGYGDIGVHTRVEFLIAIIFMFVGVLFYSNILSNLLIIVSKKLEDHEYISEKTYLLKSLRKELNIKN